MSTLPLRPHLRLPGTGEPNTAFGLTRELLVTAADSDGRLSVWLETVPPGSGPPLHRHLVEHETFHVVAGKVLFACGETRVEIGAGGLIMIPPATPHTFFNRGTEPARLMVSMTPGGLEDFFREVAAADPDPPAVTTIAGRYNLEFVGPPLTP